MNLVAAECVHAPPQWTHSAQGLHPPRKLDQLGGCSTTPNSKEPHAWAQIETSRAGGTGIHYQPALGLDHHRPVGVAVDEHVLRVAGEQRRGRGTPQLVAVAHVNGDPVELGDVLRRQLRIARYVGVAVDGVNWRDEPQLPENIATAYIAGMKDQFHAREGAVNMRADQPVGVRDQADETVGHHPSYAPRRSGRGGARFSNPATREDAGSAPRAPDDLAFRRRSAARKRVTTCEPARATVGILR